MTSVGFAKASWNDVATRFVKTRKSIFLSAHLGFHGKKLSKKAGVNVIISGNKKNPAKP